MIGTLKIVALAAVVGATASLANAAPLNSSPLTQGLSGDIQLVHGDHRDCRRDRRGWHRHNRFGERRECREWRGEGRRPANCVRVGPVWLCDY